MHASPAPSSVRAEPNVTPMIDVMLVLLVIFMLVIPAMMNGFTAEPPRAANLRAHPADDGDRVLGIDAHGRLFLNRQPVSRDRLPARLGALFAGRADRTLYVTADRGLDYRVVGETLDLAAASGVHVVGLVAERGPTPRR